MRIDDPKLLAALAALDVELQHGASLAELTRLGIGGTTDLLRIGRHESIADLLNLLDHAAIPHKFLGGGSNLLVIDGELPFVILQLTKLDADVIIEGNVAHVDAAADLGRTARREMEILKGDQISFEYRHTSFAPDDMMLSVKLELPSKPYQEILQGIRLCNEKRRSSQPLGQKSAGCIFKNPPGGSTGRMIDELGLKGHAFGDARVSDRHANFFVNRGQASATDMLALMADVRERVRQAYGVTLENEVVVWNA